MEINKLIEGLKEEDAKFRQFSLDDINPLGGTRKKRTIFAPNETMRIVHRRLMRFLRSKFRLGPSAQGAVIGCSPARNVSLHRKNRYFYILDLSNAYDSVEGWKLARILRREGKSVEQVCLWDDNLEDIDRFLKRYCLSPKGGLAAGAPASPDLFNIYTDSLIDRSLVELAKRYGLRYTRYLDDLVFSSGKVPIGDKKRRAIRAIIETAGFKVNHRKCRVIDLKKGPVVINGVGLEFGGRLFLPRRFARRIGGLVHLLYNRLTDAGRLSESVPAGQLTFDVPGALTNKQLSVVNGLRGVFWGICRGQRLTASDKKIVEKLCLLKTLLRSWKREGRRFGAEG